MRIGFKPHDCVFIGESYWSARENTLLGIVTPDTLERVVNDHPSEYNMSH